jgi:hypothetical protein
MIWNCWQCNGLNLIFIQLHCIIQSYGEIPLIATNILFKQQKKIIRIITNFRNRDSCGDLFKKLNILPFYCQYIFSLLIFVIDNISLFKQIRSYMKSILVVKTISILHSQGCKYMEIMFIIWVLTHLITCLLT